MVGCCKYGNEHPGYLNTGNFLTGLCQYKLSCRYHKVSSYLLGLWQLGQLQTVRLMLKCDTVLHIIAARISLSEIKRKPSIHVIKTVAGLIYSRKCFRHKLLMKHGPEPLAYGILLNRKCIKKHVMSVVRY